MYGIYALVNLFSPNSLARCTRSFVLRKQINACVNTIRQHFPLRNLYILNGGENYSKLNFYSYLGIQKYTTTGVIPYENENYVNPLSCRASQVVLDK